LLALVIQKAQDHAQWTKPGEHIASRERAVESEHLPPLDARVVRRETL